MKLKVTNTEVPFDKSVAAIQALLRQQIALVWAFVKYRALDWEEAGL
jgi:hypothetical protein